jgi:hypothetical protein
LHGYCTPGPPPQALIAVNQLTHDASPSPNTDSASRGRSGQTRPSRRHWSPQASPSATRWIGPVGQPAGRRHSAAQQIAPSDTVVTQALPESAGRQIAGSVVAELRDRNNMGGLRRQIMGGLPLCPGLARTCSRSPTISVARGASCLFRSSDPGRTIGRLALSYSGRLLLVGLVGAIDRDPVLPGRRFQRRGAPYWRIIALVSGDLCDEHVL